MGKGIDLSTMSEQDQREYYEYLRLKRKKAAAVGSGGAVPDKQTRGKPWDQIEWLGFKAPVDAAIKTAKNIVSEMGKAKRLNEQGKERYVSRVLQNFANAFALAYGVPLSFATKAISQGFDQMTFGASTELVKKAKKGLANMQFGFGLGKNKDVVKKVIKKASPFLESELGKDTGAVITLGAIGLPVVKALIPKTGGAISAVKRGVGRKMSRLGVSTEKRALGLNPTQMEELRRKNISPDIVFKEKLGVSIKRMPGKLEKRINGIETDLQKTLSGIDATVDITDVMPKLQKIIEKSQISAAGSKYSGAENKAMELLKEREKWLWGKSNAGRVSISDANKIKRDLYKQAEPVFKSERIGHPIPPGMKTEAQIKKDMSVIMKDKIEEAAGSGGPKIKALNAREGALLNFKPMVERAAVKYEGRQLPGRIGLYEIMAASGIGSSVGYSGGIVKGLLAGGAAAAATMLPRSSVAARTLYSTGKALQRPSFIKSSRALGRTIGKGQVKFSEIGQKATQLNKQLGQLGSIDVGAGKRLVPALKSPKTGKLYKGTPKAFNHKAILNLDLAKAEPFMETTMRNELLKDNAGLLSKFVGFIDDSGKFISRFDSEKQLAQRVKRSPLMQFHYAIPAAVGLGAIGTQR